jgi:phospholipase C
MRALALFLVFLVACSSEESENAPPATTAGPGGGGGQAGAGGAGGGAGNGGSGAECPSAPLPDPQKEAREACTFEAGALVADTIGLDEAVRRSIPIQHVVIVMEENRSFDHMLGHLGDTMQPDAESVPASFENLDLNGAPVTPFHLDSTCLEADPPHQWAAMHTGWNDGAMDGFVVSAAVNGHDGHYVMGGYDANDLPFYHFVGATFAISDRYFGAALGGTWANRDYLYAATSDGVMNTNQAVIDVPTIFDALDAAGVSWGVYTDGNVRQDSLGWNNLHAGVGNFTEFLAALDDGTLPAVAFVDPGPGQDRHPAADVQPGEAWGKTIYDHAIASPLWPALAVIYTYDESGGLADHVPPPPACIPSPDQAEFDRLGIRVPLYLISPWARPSFVSHETHSHTSALRFVELLHDIPALTARDANSDAMLDLFDFACDALLEPPLAPAAGMGGCP